MGLSLPVFQQDTCESLQINCASLNSTVECYVFPNSTEAGKWTAWSSFSPSSANAATIAVCPKLTTCLFSMTPNSETATAYSLQARSESQPILISVGKFSWPLSSVLYHRIRVFFVYRRHSTYGIFSNISTFLDSRLDFRGRRFS